MQISSSEANRGTSVELCEAFDVIEEDLQLLFGLHSLIEIGGTFRQKYFMLAISV